MVAAWSSWGCSPCGGGGHLLGQLLRGLGERVQQPQRGARRHGAQLLQQLEQVGLAFFGLEAAAPRRRESLPRVAARQARRQRVGVVGRVGARAVDRLSHREGVRACVEAHLQVQVQVQVNVVCTYVHHTCSSTDKETRCVPASDKEDVSPTRVYDVCEYVTRCVCGGAHTRTPPLSPAAVRGPHLGQGPLGDVELVCGEGVEAVGLQRVGAGARRHLLAVG